LFSNIIIKQNKNTPNFSLLCLYVNSLTMSHPPSCVSNISTSKANSTQLVEALNRTIKVYFSIIIVQAAHQTHPKFQDSKL